MSVTKRRVFVVSHTGRPLALTAANRACKLLIHHGITPVLFSEESEAMRGALADIWGKVEVYSPESGDKPLAELAVVLGGDGTILRAAELVRGLSIPLLGINLGHFGFLAESERDDLDAAVRRIVDREYEVELRMALEVVVYDASKPVYRSWALNEVTVEKASREKMLWTTVEINGTPLSSFGCDGVVISTPTGSTAYAFSGGGPIIWPTVEALLFVPLSAHALFSRPLVVSPTSTIAVEVSDGGMQEGAGVVWCDGRRTFSLGMPSRIEVRRSTEPVRLARLRRDVFVDRLVNKFSLPVSGWRGPVAGSGMGSTDA